MRILWTEGSVAESRDENGRLFEVSFNDKVIEFDATISENHVSSATATEHPVETGANVSDHVRPGIDRVSFEAHVTNAPLATPRSQADGAEGVAEGVTLDLGTRGEITKGAKGSSRSEITEVAQQASAKVLRFAQSFDRPRAVYEELRALVQAGTVVRIETELRDYESMVIVGLSTPREAVDAITFSIDAIQVRLVDSEIVEAPIPREVRGQRSRNRGTQPATPASADDARASRTTLQVWTNSDGRG